MLPRKDELYTQIDYTLKTKFIIQSEYDYNSTGFSHVELTGMNKIRIRIES